jgi:hypothetical protein
MLANIGTCRYYSGCLGVSVGAAICTLHIITMVPFGNLLQLMCINLYSQVTVAEVSVHIIAFEQRIDETANLSMLAYYSLCQKKECNSSTVSS